MHDLLHGDYTGIVDDFVVRRGDGVPRTTWPSWSTTRRGASTRWCAATTCCRHRRVRRIWPDLLGHPEPTYAHVALVLNEDGARLAKRDGAVTLAEIGAERALAQIADSLGYPATTVEQMLTQFDPPCAAAATVDIPGRMSRTLGPRPWSLLASAGDRLFAARPAGAVGARDGLPLGLRFVGRRRRTPIKSAGVLRVGTEGVYSPFSYHDPATGELVGYDVDVAKAVGEKLGVRVEFVETPWDSIFAALEANRFDVVANQVTINPERQGKYDLSQPYTVGEGVIVTRANDNSIKTLADIKGKTAAENATSNWSEVARKAGANVETVEGFTQAITLLNQGRVDVVINDSIAVYAYLAETGDKSVKIAGTVGEKSEQGFAARKDSGYLPELNRRTQ